MNSMYPIAVCFFQNDYADNYYNRGSDLFYQGIQFPKGSKYEGYKFYVESMSIKNNDNCDLDDPNRSFNMNKLWVYFYQGRHVNIQNIETNEIKQILAEEVKEEMQRKDYNCLKEIPPFIIEQYGKDYEAIKERFLSKYRNGQRVVFNIGDESKKGEILHIDTFGTFEQNEEPSYEILVDEEDAIYKHVQQSQIRFVLD